MLIHCFNINIYLSFANTLLTVFTKVNLMNFYTFGIATGINGAM